MIIIARMKQIFFILLVLACLFANCSSPPPSHPTTQKREIMGRENIPIYQAQVPNTWDSEPPLLPPLIYDTTQPIATYLIKEQEAIIRITVHNFPSDQIETRIPPQTQVARWKRQFSKIDPTTLSITPQAYGGFSGLLFEAMGTLKGKETAVMGWSMQLAQEHYRNLSYPYSPNEKLLFKQMRSDYTIKAVGDPSLMKRHKKQILKFARSFELIHEIPINS